MPMTKLTDRQARLSQALRENLKRRKAHGRQSGDASSREEEALAETENAKSAHARPNPAGKSD